MSAHVKKLLEEIKAEKGFVEARIAAECGVSQPTINRILNGQPDCKGKTMREIMKLHDRLFSAEAA